MEEEEEEEQNSKKRRREEVVKPRGMMNEVVSTKTGTEVDTGRTIEIDKRIEG